MNTATAEQVLPNDELVSDGNPASVVDPSNQVTANVEDLIIGRTLRYPIHDNSGLLLLAEGLTLTENFKQMLETRKISSVQVHADDFPHLTFQSATEPEEQHVKLDEALVKSLDEIMDTGLLFVVNSEPAVLEQMANHGCKKLSTR